MLKQIEKFLTVLLVSASLMGLSSFAEAKIAKRDMTDIVKSHFNPEKEENTEHKFSKLKDSIASLRFVWNTPVSVAAFERNGKIWVVFDRVNNLDIKTIKDEAKGLAKEIYTLPHPIGTIVVIEPEEGVKFALRKEGLLWIMDLYLGRAPKFEQQNITIFTQFDSLKNSYLFIPTTFAGNIIPIIDPELGDIISISTTSQLGLGYDTFYRYPDFDILKTSQGLAFVLNSPDIMLNRGNSGITLKAIGRSLNITSDLETLKQQQLMDDSSQNAKLKSPFDLNIAQEIADKSFLEVVDNFKKQILSVPMDEKNALRIKLAQYYVYNGMGQEALYILDKIAELDLPESKTDYFHAMSGVANFLARRWQKAEDHFAYGRIPDTEEGVFWRTVAQSAHKFEEGNNAVIMANISLMRDYPQPIKDEIAIIAARNAIESSDDLLAQNFIDILNSVPDRFRDLTPQITYLMGQKLEMQGYLRNAIKEYQKLVASNSGMFSAYGRLRYTILSQMVNFMTAKEAIAELEKLRFAWGEKKFQIQLLNKLADFYLKAQDYYNALRVLNEEGFLVEDKVAISKKMVKVFEDIFIGNHADEALTPVKSLSLYDDFSWLCDLSQNKNLILQKLADRLVAVDLLPRAKDILFKLMMQEDLSVDDMGRVGARLAIIYLFEGLSEQALDTLNSTEGKGMSADIAGPRRLIKAKALSSLGKTDEALKLLANDYSRNALLYRFEIYWKAQDWDNASNTIRYLIEEPQKGKALSAQQINYILDWATTLKKSGKETVLVRLRNKFAPYFKGTSQESVFNVLTSRLEKEEVNINQIRSVINEIQDFNAFAKFYTKALEEKIEQ